MTTPFGSSPERVIAPYVAGHPVAEAAHAVGPDKMRVAMRAFDGSPCGAPGSAPAALAHALSAAIRVGT